MYKPIYDDLLLVQQNIINYKIKIEVYNFNDEVIEEINCGLISGNISIDAESDIRRTASLVLSPDTQQNLNVDENNIIWLNKKIKIYIGIQDTVTEEYKYWANGIYVFMNTNATYDAVTNQISVDCSDMMSYWDGTRSGKIGSKKIEYPAYVESIFEVIGGTEWITQKDEAVFAYKCTTLTDKPYYNTNFNFTYIGSTHNIETSDLWSVTYQKEDRTNITLTNQKASDWGIFGKGTFTSNSFYVHYFYKNGEPISYNYIRDAMINAVTQLGQLTRYNIDWLGEAKAQPNYLADWDYEQYRKSTTVVGLDGKNYLQCFTIPHDIEFTSDTTVLSVVTELRDLYENYETFFDEDGIFYCKLIPSGDDDEIVIDYDFIDSILISEETTLDFSEVKNVTEAWGKCFEPEWFTQVAATFSNNTYSVTFPGYIDEDHTDYSNGDEVAFLVNRTNADNPKLIINNLTAIDILDENTETGISAGTMIPNKVYTFKIKKTYDTQNRTYIIKAYFQGNWEVHAMDVLTDGSVGEDVTLNPNEDVVVTIPKYSKEYFQNMFNCDNVHLTVIKDSPFTIQKLGVLLNVYNNENMTSDSLGSEGARQENYRTCRLTDNITITTKLCPFLDVNQKVRYRRKDKENPEEYLIKHIEHDLSSGTTSLQLVKYYRLYTSDEEISETTTIAENYIPKNNFVLYNQTLNISNKTLYFDISLPIDIIRSNLELCFVAEENTSEYGIKLYCTDNSLRNIVVKNNNQEDTVNIYNLSNIKHNIRIVFNNMGLFINGENISSSLLSNVISKILQLGKIKIYGNNDSYCLNKVSIINEALSQNTSINKSKIMVQSGFYINSNNNTTFIETGFKPKYIAVLTGTVNNKYSNTTQLGYIYNEDYSNEQYRYSASNGLYRSNSIDAYFREDDPIGQYNLYPPGIYSVDNDGFTMCKNNGIIQNYFALPDIDSINFMNYSDKFAKGEFNVIGGANRTYDVDLGFSPKCIALIQTSNDGEKTIIIYYKDYNSGKFLKSDSNNMLTEKKIGIQEAESLYEIKDLGFTIREPLLPRSYKYFAIG